MSGNTVLLQSAAQQKREVKRETESERLNHLEKTFTSRSSFSRICPAQTRESVRPRGPHSAGTMWLHPLTSCRAHRAFYPSQINSWWPDDHQCARGKHNVWWDGVHFTQHVTIHLLWLHFIVPLSRLFYKNKTVLHPKHEKTNVEQNASGLALSTSCFWLMFQPSGPARGKWTSSVSCGRFSDLPAVQ